MGIEALLDGSGGLRGTTGDPTGWERTGTVEGTEWSLGAPGTDVTGAGGPFNVSMPAATDGGATVPGDEPDAYSSGWVRPQGRDAEDAIFVLAGSSLGIGRTASTDPPVWIDLDRIHNLDAIGDVVDGSLEVEITLDDGRTIGARWSEAFCDRVVEALLVSAGRVPPPPPETEAAPAPETVAAAPEPVPPVAAGPFEMTGETSLPDGPLPGEGTAAGIAPVPGSTALVLEDVVYLRGHPAHARKRKKCVATLDAQGIEVVGPGGLAFTLPWTVVRSVEAQNCDEARFRMNVKIHRDATALVVECEDGVTVLLEARDCPTVPLRSAITQLVSDLRVVVV